MTFLPREIWNGLATVCTPSKERLRMKFTKDDIGKKFRLEMWGYGEYFLVLGITSKGVAIGEDEKGDHYFNVMGLENWLPYVEPKKKIRLAPALVKCSVEENTFRITNNLFHSEAAAKQEVGFGHDIFVRWPAPLGKDGFVEVESEI